MMLWIIVTVLVIICLALLAELARVKEDFADERRRLKDEAEYLRRQITNLSTECNNLKKVPQSKRKKKEGAKNE